MRFTLFTALAFMLLCCPCPARADSPEQSFNQLNACVKAGDTDHCRDLLTASSAPLYNRFVGYGLVKCLPHDASYLSQEAKGQDVWIRAITHLGGTERHMRMAFVQEEGKWKLDVPESLHRAMGDNWQQQLNLTEQIYIMLKKQLGDQLDCSMIQNLGNKNANAN